MIFWPVLYAFDTVYFSNFKNLFAIVLLVGFTNTVSHCCVYVYYVYILCGGTFIVWLPVSGHENASLYVMLPRPSLCKGLTEVMSMWNRCAISTEQAHQWWACASQAYSLIAVQWAGRHCTHYISHFFCAYFARVVHVSMSAQAVPSGLSKGSKGPLLGILQHLWTILLTDERLAWQSALP